MKAHELAVGQKYLVDSGDGDGYQPAVVLEIDLQKKVVRWKDLSDWECDWDDPFDDIPMYKIKLI